MSAQYLITLGDEAQLPKLIREGFLQGRGEPRLALVGRSNVGKSTLINTLVGQGIARASKTPGKTQAIHFFYWPEERFVLADLPGYGYARRSKGDRDRWAEFIGEYLRADPRLATVLLLVDSRHPPSEQDDDAWRFLNSVGVGVTLVLTKVDQIRTQADLARRQKEMKQWLKERGAGDQFDELHWVSSKGKGLNRLVESLRELRVKKGEG